MEFVVEWHNRLGSTSTCMKERFSLNDAVLDGTIIAAKEQTAGQGRRGNRWLSSPETNLCFSLFVETDVPPPNVYSLTMAVVLAVVEALDAWQISAVPKWPNDVLVNEKKICGILSEQVQKESIPCRGIVLGIGLNVNMSAEEAALIDRPATSMRLESGRAYKLNRTLESLLPLLNNWIQKWKEDGFSSLRGIWTEKTASIGKSFRVHEGGRCKSGTITGYGEHGELLLQTRNGLEAVWSGETR